MIFVFEKIESKNIETTSTKTTNDTTRHPNIRQYFILSIPALP